MPTIKNRINMCATSKGFELISYIADAKETSRAAIAWQLVEEALEMHEDKWLMELIKAHELEGDHERVPAEEVFKRCGLI
jgi:hypothetical protein